MRKLSIIWLSFFPLLAGAVLSPSLSAIAKAYPSVPEIWIKSLVTIPSICVVFGQSIQISLSRKMSVKNQVLIGLVLYSCGVIPFVSHHFYMLIISRIVLGIGLSILVPHTIGLIQGNFQGNEQKKMLGYSSALNNFGTVAAVLYSGLVSNNDWHFVFLIYLLALPSLILIFYFLPNSKETTQHDNQSNQDKLTLKIFRVLFKMFLLTVIYFVIPTNLSFYMFTQFYQDNSFAVGIVMAFISLSGVISGLVFSRFPGKKSNQTQEMIIITLFIISMILLSIAQTFQLFVFALLMSGWALGWGLPCFNQQLIATIGRKKSKFIGVGQAMIFLGQFASPFIISFFAQFLHASNPFIISTGLMFLLLGVVMVDFNKK